MNKTIMKIAVIVLTVIFCVQADAGSNSGGGNSQAVVVGGCCRKWTRFDSTEDAPWKVVPEDIQALPDTSTFREKYEKAFELVPKSVKSWIRQGFTKRYTYFKSKMWVAEKAKLETVLARNTRIDREGCITRAEVVEMAEQMLVYGRALKFGGMAVGNLREVADRYGFKRVSDFLKDTMDFKRFKKRGCGKVYPKEDPEFKAFDELMTAWHSTEWSEYRAKLEEMNKKFRENPQKARTAQR